MNSVNLVGNAVADPQTTIINTGDKKVSFNIAVRAYGDNTDFFTVVAWRKTADVIEKYVFKGDKVGISGRLSSRKYEDKNGERRTVVEVVAECVDLLTSKKESAKEEEQRGAMRPADDDEDLPF